MADEDLIRAEGMAVGAARWWSGHPAPVRRLHQITQHTSSIKPTALGEVVSTVDGAPRFFHTARGMKIWRRGLCAPHPVVRHQVPHNVVRNVVPRNLLLRQPTHEGTKSGGD
jgi:hypothetical protein